MVLKHNVVNLEKVKNNKKFQGRLRKKCEGVNFLFFTAESLYSLELKGDVMKGYNAFLHFLIIFLNNLFIAIKRSFENDYLLC